MEINTYPTAIGNISHVAFNAHSIHNSTYIPTMVYIMATSYPFANAVKKATNVSLSEPLIAEAKELRINISQAAEAGVAKAVAEKRAEIWVAENAKAFECWNAHVELNGLPLDKYRSF